MVNVDVIKTMNPKCPMYTLIPPKHTDNPAKTGRSPDRDIIFLDNSRVAVLNGERTERTAGTVASRVLAPSTSTNIFLVYSEPCTTNYKIIIVYLFTIILLILRKLGFGKGVIFDIT